MKIGIMSFAHIHAEAYIENLKQIEEVELIGIADDNEERGKLYANRYGARFFYSYEALLNENPEGVLICSENVAHRPLVEIAAAAGVHVMCEKPLATTLEDGRAILRTCEKAGIILMTAFPMRFSPPIVETRDLLRKGGLGKIYCCNSRNQGQMPKHHREWFVDRKLAGGGAVADHTVHLADILRWFLDCEAKEVFARSNRLLHGDEVEVETGGLIMVTFENGVFATIDCSWSRPRRYPTWGGLALELVGEKGVLNVDAFKQNITIHGGSEQHAAWSYWGSDSNQLMVQEFVNAIREKREAVVTGMDGFRALEIVDAAYRSIETGSPVKIS